MRTSFIAAISLALALPVFGQFGGLRPGGPGFLHPAGHEVVTGAPYSATVSNSVVEHLSDGNTIQRTNTGLVARDSQGRIYEQQTVNGGPLAPDGSRKLTFITDPVAGFAYVLDDEKKTAFRRVFKARNANSPRQGFEHTHKADANVAEADLAPDSSTGVTAEGKSITHTIPAGTIGNAQPIVSTVQRWYSSDLKVVVKSIRKDPRIGESTYALSNITRAEPDPALFQVPAGYTVQDSARGAGAFRALRR